MVVYYNSGAPPAPTHIKSKHPEAQSAFQQSLSRLDAAPALPPCGRPSPQVSGRLNFGDRLVLAQTKVICTSQQAILLQWLFMLSLEYDRFGRAEDVTVIRERPLPTPAAHEVLVKVRAAALNPKDVLVRKGKFALLSGRGFPRQMGYDFAGEVQALGRGVLDLREGEGVFGMLNPCRSPALLTRVAQPPSSRGCCPSYGARRPRSRRRGGSWRAPRRCRRRRRCSRPASRR